MHNIARARSRKRTMDIALPGSAWLPRYTLIRLLPALSLLSSLVHIGSNVETNSSEERLHSRDARRRELAIRSLPKKSVDVHEAATLRASALAAARTYFSKPIKMGFQMYVEGRWLASSLWLLLGAMAVRRLATRR